jgi:hypothetical protein
MQLKEGMMHTAEVHTTPWRVLVAAWVGLAALTVVFAKEIDQWVVTQQGHPVGPRLAALSGALREAAQFSGVEAARGAVASAVLPFYDHVVVLAAGPAAAGAVPAPPRAQSAGFATGQGKTVQVQQAGGALYQPKNVLILGASSIQEGLGTELERALEKYQGVSVTRFGQYSSGLARPDYFDWAAKLKELKAKVQPDLIIGQWGENDCQGQATRDGKAVAKFGTPEWDSEYTQRVKEMVGIMREGGCHAAIIGIPNMRPKGFAKQVARLNKVTEDAAVAAGGVFLSTWDLTSDEHGDYLATVNVDGKNKLMRAGDGIHFSTYGAVYIASKLCEKLQQDFTFVPMPASGGN